MCRHVCTVSENDSSFWVCYEYILPGIKTHKTIYVRVSYEFVVGTDNVFFLLLFILYICVRACLRQKGTAQKFRK